MISKIFHFLNNSRKAWLTFILMLWAGFAYLALQIHIQEDVSKTLPQDDALEQYQDFFRRSPIASKIVVAIGSRNPSADPAEVIHAANVFISHIDSASLGLIDTVQHKFGLESAPGAFDLFYAELPLFLSVEKQDSVFENLDSTAVRSAVNRTLTKLVSPESYALKSFLLRDPLGLYPQVLQNLSGLQEGGDFKLENNHLFTEDGRYTLVFISPAFPPSESKNNGLLVEALQNAADQLKAGNKDLEVYMFGGPVVAAKNGEQIRKDTRLTAALAVVLILSLLIWYYRKLLIPFLFLLPPLFGMTVAVGSIYLVRGEISILTLAAGSIVLGIALDYCFHLFTHLKHSTSVVQTLEDISGSLLLSCFTTVLAFLSLLFLNSQILTDFGLLASFSLMGTLFFVLLVQPVIIENLGILNKINVSQHWVDRIFSKDIKWRRPVLLAMVAITLFLAFFVGRVSFEDDLNKINYFPEELRQAEAVITASDKKEKSVFVVSRAGDFQSAIDRNARVTQRLDSLAEAGLVNSVVSLNHIFPTSSEIQKRSKAWNERIASGRSDELVREFKAQSGAVGMKPESFSPFYQTLTDSATSHLHYPPDFLGNSLFENFIVSSGEGVEVINIVNTRPGAIQAVDESLRGTGALVVDKTLMAHSLISVVKDNFNLILLITTSLVFLTLLINYGRIELALMTFFPMVVSWFWILGICGLFDIRFNFINVLITTFIFGLGDDFCIFVTDGLLSKFKLGKNKLASYRSSIILSTTTTIIGTGVLLFAKHPALQSIALLSVIGMLCISFVSLTLQPILFHFAAQKRKEKKLAPLTLFIIITSIISFGYFALGCVVVTLLIPVFYITPIPKKYKRRVFSYIASKFSWSVIYLMMNVRKQVLNPSGEKFEKPAIIVANHQSFVDILAILMLNPKIVILTNKWVWNSPLFGWAVRYAGFPTATSDLDENLPGIEKSLEQGYSIAIFPEGTRSVDGKIKRFHKGAFYLAEKYNLDIVPVLLHGFDYTIRKSDYTLMSGHLTISILDRISPGDTRFGSGYRARTKAISAYMKKEFQKLRDSEETTRYFRDTVISNYIYKGPVLEWYVKIKLKIENNFQRFDRYCPESGTIYDIGCGYGYVSYMLNFTSEGRHVTGVDYDHNKIAVAANCWANNERLNFVAADLNEYLPAKADCYLIKDVLHYLSEEKQNRLLEHCAVELRAGGRIIIRDGFKEEDRHRTTQFTEVMSTRILSFNKAESELSFLNEGQLYDLAKKFNLKIRRVDENKRSSNRTFVLEKE